MLLLAGCASTWSPQPTWVADDRGYTTGLAWADVDGDGSSELVSSAGNDIEPGPVRVLGPSGEVVWTGDEAHYHGHMSAADLDGDGSDDIAVTRYLGDDGDAALGGVDLYFGSSAGLAGSPDWSWTGAGAFGVALADVDGDGHLDLALATGQVDGDAVPDLVFLGDGAGLGSEPDWQSAPSLSFDVAVVAGSMVFARHDGPHARYPGLADAPDWLAPGAGFAGNRIASGDVDGDGVIDLLISDNVEYPGAGEVRLYCGVEWALCWSEGGNRAWSAVDLQDVDGDGDLDVLTGEWFGPLRAFENDEGAIGDEVWTSEDELVAEAFAWRAGQLAVSDWDPGRGTWLFE